MKIFNTTDKISDKLYREFLSLKNYNFPNPNDFDAIVALSAEEVKVEVKMVSE
jgi:hypothetical protein